MTCELTHSWSRCKWGIFVSRALFTKHSTGLCGICFCFFFSKCGFFAKLTCCEFTVGPPRFSINYNPVNGVSICEEKKEGCCHLCEPRQYIQPRLASYDWGKCGPDTLPFTGRQRLHYANVTTRGKESEWASRREREREGRKANKQESVKKRGASRKRGRAPRRESERAEPHSLYMRGRTCCHLPHLNAPPKTPRSLFSTRHLNWVRQVLEDRFRCICKDTETVSEWYKRAHGEPFCSWYLRFSGWYGFYLSTRVAFQIGQHIHFPFFFHTDFDLCPDIPHLADEAMHGRVNSLTI